MPTKIIFAFVLVVALALPATATAAPAYEPNDGIHQAYGPLEANKNYDAVISSNSDIDWYVFYTSGGGNLKIELKDIGQKCSSMVADLKDAEGDDLVQVWSSGDTEEVSYVAPGSGAFYLRVWAYDGWSTCNGGAYRLKVTGPLTSGPRPGPPDQVVPNNNPDRESAFGPLDGGRLYGGTIFARGEQDWFYFHTARAGEFDISVTNFDSRCCGNLVAVLYDGEGNELNSIGIATDRIRHLRYAASGPAKFYLLIRSGKDHRPDHYQFRIDPAGLITRTAPPSSTETQPPAGGGSRGSDSSAPSILLRDKQLRVKKNGVVRLRVSCLTPASSSPCSGNVRLVTQGPVKFRGKKRRVELARTGFRSAPGETVNLRFKIGPSKWKLLKSNGSARKTFLVFTTSDAADNTSRQIRKKFIRMPGGSGGPKVTLIDKRLRVQRNRRALRMRVACRKQGVAPPCTATVRIVTQKPVFFRGKKRRVELARTSFRSAPGKTVNLAFRVGPSKWKLLQRNGLARKSTIIFQVKDGKGRTARQTRSKFIQM